MLVTEQDTDFADLPMNPDGNLYVEAEGAFQTNIPLPEHSALTLMCIHMRCTKSRILLHGILR